MARPIEIPEDKPNSDYNGQETSPCSPILSREDNAILRGSRKEQLSDSFNGATVSQNGIDFVKEDKAVLEPGEEAETSSAFMGIAQKFETLATEVEVEAEVPVTVKLEANTPATILEKLARDKSAEVRLAVARHPNTAKAELELPRQRYRY